MKTQGHPLGNDKHGFSYWLFPDNYAYQWYPDRDIFRNGINMRDKPNGWFCSYPAWARTLHKLITVTP